MFCTPTYMTSEGIHRVISGTFLMKPGTVKNRVAAERLTFRQATKTSNKKNQRIFQRASASGFGISAAKDDGCTNLATAAMGKSTNVPIPVSPPPLRQSALPDVMYGWRVKALDNWLEARTKRKQAEEEEEGGSKNDNPAGGGSSRLSMEELKSLGHLDQYHYRGLEACDEAIEALGLDSSARVLDVGAGVGGPARYMAHKTGSSITGVELQSQLVEAGQRLNIATGLGDKVQLIVGDICDSDVEFLPANSLKFTHALSLLVILHIPDRAALFSRIYDSLQDEEGGVLLIEDMTLTALGEQEGWTSSEQYDTTDVMGAAFIPSIADYIAHLEAANFVDIEFRSLTEDWCPWAIQRAKQYEEDKESQIRTHGQVVFEDRLRFYQAIARLFASGKLGGSRITCRKPSKWESKLNQGLQLEAASKDSSAKMMPGSKEVKIIETLESKNTNSDPIYPEKVEGKTLETKTSLATFPLGAHDCWQWHFLPAENGEHTAAVVRVWQSDTSVFRSWAWVYNTLTGEQETLFDTKCVEGTDVSKVLRFQEDGTMIVSDFSSGRVMTVKDDLSENGVGSLIVYPSADLSSLPTPLLRVDFECQVKTGWSVPSQTDEVFHRPVLLASVELPGTTTTSTSKCLGYSKRYYGDYPREWAYQFIVALQDKMASIEPVDENDIELQAEAERRVIWTADASFGPDDYNYWKEVVAAAGSEVQSEDSSECYHQGRVGNCRDKRIELDLLSKKSVMKTELSSKKGAHSLLTEALCNCTLRDRISGEVIWRGLAFNETCMGSI
mmetsp:Transcript_23561/g.32467  ORF Transcript_23561/g.32467 Transcript_23561/m.32467 type:complete len:784 (+) Transcript_23561:54-2405(+)